MQSKTRNIDARIVYYLLEGATALLFHLYLAIYGVYYAAGVGLDPLQIVLLGTIFETTIFLFEVPTGVIADAYSRRLSVLLGLVLIGAGLLLEGVLPMFAALAAAQIIGGIGATLISGASEAWISDEIGVEHTGKVFIRAAQIRVIAGVIGVTIGVLLGSVNLSLSFIAAGIGFFVLAGVLTLVMPERGFKSSARRTWRDLLETVQDGVQLVKARRGVLLPLLIVAFLFGFHSEGYDMLWQTHFLLDFALPPFGALPPLAWFGALTISANLVSIVFSESVRRRVDLTQANATARALLWVYGAAAVGVIAFALAGKLVWAALAYIVVSALRAVGKPIADAWLNQHSEPQMRATMFSLYSQTNSIGEMVGGVPVGAVGKFVSLRMALSVCGVVLALTVPILARLRGNERPADHASMSMPKG